MKPIYLAFFLLLLPTPVRTDENSQEHKAPDLQDYKTERVFHA